jgi:triphosphatase
MSPSPLSSHLSSLLEQRLGQLADAARGSSQGRSVEAVHELRVASRRLRAFTVTFRDLLGEPAASRLEKKLKRVTRAAGALRDLDVQLEALDARLATTSGQLERAALEHLLENLDGQRTKAERRARRQLRRLELGAIPRLVRRGLRGIRRGLPDDSRQRAYALGWLERLVANAAEQAPATDEAEDAERLHGLRIDIKQLRYSLELFEPLLGADFEALRARATALQDLLGAHHDLVTLGEVIRRQAAELGERQRNALALGLAGVEAELAEERAEVFRRFRSEGFGADAWREALQQALEGG